MRTTALLPTQVLLERHTGLGQISNSTPYISDLEAEPSTVPGYPVWFDRTTNVTVKRLDARCPKHGYDSIYSETVGNSSPQFID